MTTDHKFQVNLRGIIDLLSNHLYSGPQVYVRELLQNANDAIVARTQFEPGHLGEVKLEVVPGGEGAPTTLAVHDNGVGLTEAEVHQFLATIGQSSKRESLHREDFIGQFGIGLLSGFVVSEEIVVITRSIQPGASTIEWRGRGDGTYSMRILEHEFEPGTQVFLRAKPGCHEFFETDFVRRMAAHFGSHLPYPIHVSGGGERWKINEDPPWRVEHVSEEMKREAQLAYGQRVFGMEFLDAIDLSTEVGGIDGVAFILPFGASIAAKRANRVYLKNMLLSEQADNLLPEWAFFVRCVVNATDLRPTAARESFYEDDQLDQARHALGMCLRRYLVRLAHEDRARLDRLISLHYLAIKALAVEDDEFYRMFVDWLPFETSLGHMTLEEYCRHSRTVQYVWPRDQFMQVVGVAAAQGICIVNAGYVYDRDLLEKLPHLFPDRRVERMDVSDLAQTFAELTLEEREEVFDLVKLADAVLQPFKTSVEIKKFVPDELPTLYTTNDAATFMRSVEQTKEVADDLWSGVLDRIAEDPTASAYAQLCLNYKNALIRKLAGLEDRKLAGRAVQMLYVQALLLGHYPLNRDEMQLMSRGLLGLIEYCVDARPEG